MGILVGVMVEPTKRVCRVSSAAKVRVAVLQCTQIVLKARCVENNMYSCDSTRLQNAARKSLYQYWLSFVPDSVNPGPHSHAIR